MTQDYAIFTQRLSRVYGEVQALVDLDLQVPYGSIFGYLGRNGAGKTTTMRLLAGLAHPTSGSAWIAGLETTNANRMARGLFGYLPQDPAFYGWMTPREYLDYIARLFELKSEQRKLQVEAMLTLADLKDVGNRQIAGFSGGMRQRLGIAQAMIGNPPVLLLDEPTSSLDPAGRYEVLDMIAGLRGKVTVFFSSHILSDIERVCDTIAVLHRGKLVLVSGRDELLEKYAVNAATLEFEVRDEHDITKITGLVRTLEDQPWVSSTKLEENILTVMVQDMELAKLNLIALVVKFELVLSRYEWVRPSLEEIFLQLSA